MQARLVIEIGDKNNNGKVDITVTAEVGAFKLPAIGPVDVDAHGALALITDLSAQAKQRLDYLTHPHVLVGHQLAPAGSVGGN